MVKKQLEYMKEAKQLDAGIECKRYASPNKPVVGYWMLSPTQSHFVPVKIYLLADKDGYPSHFLVQANNRNECTENLSPNSLKQTINSVCA